MSLQGWEEAVMTAQVAGASISNTTTAASLLPAAAKYTILTNIFSLGKVMRVSSIGQLSNIAGASAGTLTLDVRFGSNVVFNGGAAQMSSTAHTTLPYWWDVQMTCVVIGASAALMGQGRLMGQPISVTAVIDSTSTHGLLLTPNTTPANGATFDSTATQQIDHFGKFSVVTSPTNITLQQFVVEMLN
jgi:hypothetical protein